MKLLVLKQLEDSSQKPIVKKKALTQRVMFLNETKGQAESPELLKLRANRNFLKAIKEKRAARLCPECDRVIP